MKKTREEKIAEAMLQSVSDITLDLEAIGEYLGTTLPAIRYNRLEVAIDKAREERERINERRRAGHIV